eukprot:RCo014976
MPMSTDGRSLAPSTPSLSGRSWGGTGRGEWYHASIHYTSPPSRQAASAPLPLTPEAQPSCLGEWSALDSPPCTPPQLPQKQSGNALVPSPREHDAVEQKAVSGPTGESERDAEVLRRQVLALNRHLEESERASELLRRELCSKSSELCALREIVARLEESLPDTIVEHLAVAVAPALPAPPQLLVENTPAGKALVRHPPPEMSTVWTQTEVDALLLDQGPSMRQRQSRPPAFLSVVAEIVVPRGGSVPPGRVSGGASIAEKRVSALNLELARVCQERDRLRAEAAELVKENRGLYETLMAAAPAPDSNGSGSLPGEVDRQRLQETSELAELRVERQEALAAMRALLEALKPDDSGAPEQPLSGEPEVLLPFVGQLTEALHGKMREMQWQLLEKELEKFVLEESLCRESVEQQWAYGMALLGSELTQGAVSDGFAAAVEVTVGAEERLRGELSELWLGFSGAAARELALLQEHTAAAAVASLCRQEELVREGLEMAALELGQLLGRWKASSQAGVCRVEHHRQKLGEEWEGSVAEALLSLWRQCSQTLCEEALRHTCELSTVAQHAAQAQLTHAGLLQELRKDCVEAVGELRLSLSEAQQTAADQLEKATAVAEDLRRCQNL